MKGKQICKKNSLDFYRTHGELFCHSQRSYCLK